MTCPLYDFCKIACNDYRCGQSWNTCQHMRTLRNWITGLIDSAIENALEDLQ